MQLVWLALSYLRCYILGCPSILILQRMYNNNNKCCEPSHPTRLWLTGTWSFFLSFIFVCLLLVMGLIYIYSSPHPSELLIISILKSDWLILSFHICVLLSCVWLIWNNELQLIHTDGNNTTPFFWWLNNISLCIHITFCYICVLWLISRLIPYHNHSILEHEMSILSASL